MRNQYLSFIFGIFMFLNSFVCDAQKIEASILQKQWSAFWISVPNESKDAYGVYLFRKNIVLESKPTTFNIHVSADNRYKLFVNEKLVSLGPARGDLSHWNFETVDIAPYLKVGKNTVAAQVWNEGEFKPEAQISNVTAFILQGATEKEAILNTNDSWKAIRDKSYAPLIFDSQTYYVSGAGETRTMSAYPKLWKSENFDDNVWQNAKMLFKGAPKSRLGQYGNADGWMLVPSQIPQMEMKEERFAKVVIHEGGISLPIGFPVQAATFTIPAKSSVRFVLDQNHLTNAYPNLLFSGGKNATIKISYAETMFKKYPIKGNRNDTEGMVFFGRADSLIADGVDNQQFTTLTYRTYRYIEFKITTQNEPLTIKDFYGTFTGYPFELKSALTTDKAELQQILTVGWRTARLCATETYMDCPYYEQMQYIGDTRIQALVTLYNSGDERLIKNALNLMDFSRQSEGVTLSRHPSASAQYPYFFVVVYWNVA